MGTGRMKTIGNTNWYTNSKYSNKNNFRFKSIIKVTDLLMKIIKLSISSSHQPRVLSDENLYVVDLNMILTIYQ